jgi:hypothetical protein
VLGLQKEPAHREAARADGDFAPAELTACTAVTVPGDRPARRRFDGSPVQTDASVPPPQDATPPPRPRGRKGIVYSHVCVGEALFPKLGAEKEIRKEDGGQSDGLDADAALEAGAAADSLLARAESVGVLELSGRLVLMASKGRKIASEPPGQTDGQRKRI